MAAGERTYSQTVNNNMELKAGEEGLEATLCGLVTGLVKMGMDEILKMEALDSGQNGLAQVSGVIHGKKNETGKPGLPASGSIARDKISLSGNKGTANDIMRKRREKGSVDQNGYIQNLKLIKFTNMAKLIRNLADYYKTMEKEILESFLSLNNVKTMGELQALVNAGAVLKVHKKYGWTKEFQEKYYGKIKGKNSTSRRKVYKVIIESNNPLIVVGKGDTLSEIIKILAPEVNWVEVAILNNLKDPDKISTGQKILLPGSVIPDITESLMHDMRTHSKDRGIISPWYLKDKVKTGGEWDLKNIDGSIYYKGRFKYYIFNGEVIPSDAPGNIHYGYVGIAAPWAWEKLLLKEAGKYQIKSGTSKPEWQNDKYYGDDPVDQKYIKKGIDLYMRDNQEEIHKLFSE